MAAPNRQTSKFRKTDRMSPSTIAITTRPLRLTAIAVALLGYAAAASCQGGPPGMPMSPEALAKAAANPTIVAGQGWIVDKTTALESLKVEPGAAIAAPAGHSLTLSVDGVQRDLLPGSYSGKVVLTVTDDDPVKFSETMIHHFRSALYVDSNGVVPSKSVLAAAGPYQVADHVISGADIRSQGANFNGVLVTGGSWTIKGLKLDFEGNGGNDFAGFGAGVMSMGKGTTLVLDGAHVATHGAVRTTVIGNTGSNLIVKNSDISSRNGVLPADYVSNVQPGEMKDAPWMLGIRGNVRATNVLGDDTTCTYINTRLASDGWGVLSVDASQNIKLTAIDSHIELTGESGYGTYAIGNSTNSFYGSRVDVPTHGAIVTGGHVVFASSSAENVARLNRELKLNLSPAELAAIEPRETQVHSKRFGVMMWGDATVQIADGTRFETGEATFLDKGATARIDVDGSKGAALLPRNGVILQAIDNDDPGPNMAGGHMANTGVWHEPAGLPAKVAGFDLGAEHKNDIVARFSHIKLNGNFYNAIRSMQVGGGMGPGGPSREPPVQSGANLVLHFDHAEVQGVITAAHARHLKSSIGAADYQMLAEVVNTPAPAINNGVVVDLDHAHWTVTGRSHLSRLTLDAASSVGAPAGRKLVFKVDGKAQTPHAGDYRGDIVVEPAE